MSKTRITLIISIISILLLLYLFNFKSNIHLLFKSDKELFNYSIANQEKIYASSEVIVRKINIRRKHANLIHRLFNKLSRPVLYFIEFKNNQNSFNVSYHNNGSTANSNVSEDIIFSINSSFYNHKFQPNGSIIINGKELGIPSKSSGHYKVIDGVAKAGPTSIFNASEKVKFSCQSHPSIMKDGIIWEYIMDQSKNKDYWNNKTYRSIVGHKDNGNICFITSGNGGLLSI